MINLSIWLYGKPAWDLDIEGKEDIDPRIFREHGNYLSKYLGAVAEAVEKLQEAGWNCSGGLYTLELYKSRITETETRKELKELGVNTEIIHIEEFEDEE